MISKFINREVAEFAFSDAWLGESMLFIAGPRQCGKTSLARHFLHSKQCSSLYFNWDIEKIRRRYRQDPDFIAKEASRLPPRPYVVIDEIHKLTRWKNILKGLFDEYGHEFQIIVTGSARLDLFRRSGDSLVGRYTLANLFPFSLREWVQLSNTRPFPWLYEDRDWENIPGVFEKKLLDAPRISPDLAEAYYTFGPFPAPLISGSMQRSRKWHRDYITLLVREDLRDLSAIRELDRVSNLVELLPRRIGAPLSLRSLAGDLEANHTTVKTWLQALKRLYLLWPLRPFSGKIQRSMRKEPKWYFLDWTYAGNEGSRFENMIATALHRFVVSLNDRGRPEVGLHFFRTYDKKEVDFVLVHNEKPILAVEAKTGAKKIHPPMRRFREAHGNDFPIIQVVNEPGVCVKKGPGEYLAGYDRLMAIL
ncbi:MAG: ATP-binding protein [Deltaproteobacteria bacterium]|nr:ATP-binding protein [Deltaproteobacteria bacterium]